MNLYTAPQSAQIATTIRSDSDNNEQLTADGPTITSVLAALSVCRLRLSMLAWVLWSSTWAAAAGASTKKNSIEMDNIADVSNAMNNKLYEYTRCMYTAFICSVQAVAMIATAMNAINNTWASGTSTPFTYNQTKTPARTQATWRIMGIPATNLRQTPRAGR
jgi:hypothetical protein